MSLHPRILRVALGIGGFLGANAAVEAAVVSLKAVKKNNVAITPTNNLAVRGGDTIEAEIFLSDWGVELPEGVRFFQVKLDGRAGFTSGDNGTILPLGWCAPVNKINCTTSADCPAAYPTCLTNPPTGCTCAGHDPALGAFITTSRTDLLFNGLPPGLIDPQYDTDTSKIDYKYFGITGGGSVVDTGAQRYLGTLILKVSANACGTFTIGFVQEIAATFIADPASPPNVVLPFSQPLVLTVSECCRIEFPCVPAHCNIDARIAHDPRDPRIKLTTNTIMMGFCEPTTEMTPDDFEVTVVPFNPTDIMPVVSTVTPDEADPQRATVILNRRIQEARWTCVRHIHSERRCCIASLPGDVDGNGIFKMADGFELLDNLNAHVNPSLAIDKCDINRSLRCTPADLLMLVDLFNDPFACDFDCPTLPVCPSNVPPP